VGFHRDAFIHHYPNSIREESRFYRGCDCYSFTPKQHQQQVQTAHAAKNTRGITTPLQLF